MAEAAEKGVAVASVAGVPALVALRDVALHTLCFCCGKSHFVYPLRLGRHFMTPGGATWKPRGRAGSFIFLTLERKVEKDNKGGGSEAVQYPRALMKGSGHRHTLDGGYRAHSRNGGKGDSLRATTSGAPPGRRRGQRGGHPRPTPFFPT